MEIVTVTAFSVSASEGRKEDASIFFLAPLQNARKAYKFLLNSSCCFLHLRGLESVFSCAYVSCLGRQNRFALRFLSYLPSAEVAIYLVR